VCGESRMHGLERGKGRKALPIVTFRQKNTERPVEPLLAEIEGIWENTRVFSLLLSFGLRRGASGVLPF
jgi:hypothetical protein